MSRRGELLQTVAARIVGLRSDRTLLVAIDGVDGASALGRALLDPLLPRGSGRYRVAVFDHTADAPVDAPERQALPGSILVFDGIFLHRPELLDRWDFSIFLETDFAVSVARCASRDGTSPDPAAAANLRYVEGQRLYLEACNPRAHATLAIDNNDLSAPSILTPSS